MMQSAAVGSIKRGFKISHWSRVMAYFLSLLMLTTVPVEVSAELSAKKLRELWPIWRKNRSVAEVVDFYGDLVDARLKPHFDRAGVPYPPKRITLLSLKEEKSMELWALHKKKWVHVHDFAIRGASGHMGPKLREGDKQVPEGFYKITMLNPNSRYHLSLKINYPNKFDRKHARIEKRHKPGGQIFIHGTSYSIGCLAVGNPASEDIFVLAEKIGIKNIDVIIAPYDFRRYKAKRRALDPEWVDGLYAKLHKRMLVFDKKKSAKKSTSPQRGNSNAAHPDERFGL